MDLSSLFAGIVFGSIGYASWRYGRKTQKARPMVLGLALIAYPWLVPDGLWQWVAGAALTVLVFWP